MLDTYLHLCYLQWLLCDRPCHSTNYVIKVRTFGLIVLLLDSTYSVKAVGRKLFLPPPLKFPTSSCNLRHYEIYISFSSTRIKSQIFILSLSEAFLRVLLSLKIAAVLPIFWTRRWKFFSTLRQFTSYHLSVSCFW